MALLADTFCLPLYYGPNRRTGFSTHSIYACSRQLRGVLYINLRPRSSTDGGTQPNPLLLKVKLWMRWLSSLPRACISLVPLDATHGFVLHLVRASRCATRDFVLHLASGAQDVKFWPSLPKSKLAAFRRMKMCNIVKVILKFDRAALPPLLHGCICSESFIPEFWFRCAGMPKPEEREPLI